jgi:spermidine synthase
MVGRRVPEEEIFFTVGPDWPGTLPQPFRVAARTILLVDRRDPHVLLLGYGLGAMGGGMAQLRPDARIVGVEPGARYRRRARRNLPRNVELSGLGAREFLESDRRRFDLIFDDCYARRGGGVDRPPELRGSAALLRRRLRPGGVVVRNLVSPELMADWRPDLEREFGQVRLRRFRDWENVFVIASETELGGSRLRRLQP